jgi:hypothetical protein
MDTDEKLKILNEWIVKIKKDFFSTYIDTENSEKSENSEDLLKYMNYLDDLEDKLRFAITSERLDKLQELGWPDELMHCINDMNLRSEILDCLNQALTVHQFNKSPIHERELNKTL